MRSMKTKKNTTHILKSCLVLLLLGLIACTPQTPIPIFVTPTPQGEAVLPTLEAATEDPALTSMTPESTPEVTEEATDEAVPLPTLAPGQQATPLVRGPIVGPDYQVPPSSTPRPSATPTEGPATAVPTETVEAAPETPSETPLPTGPTPTPLPGLDPAEMGLQVHTLLNDEDWNTALNDIERLGLGWVKVQIDWSLLQPNGPDDLSVDFRRQELYLEALDQRGIKVLISVAKAPLWARSNHEESGPPDDPQALANFMRLMIAEFGEIVDAIEVWNEPNLLREWQGQPLNGASYMTYFDAAYHAIREAEAPLIAEGFRSEPIAIITGGPAPTSTMHYSVDDRDYLRQMYAAGLANYTDVGIGIHPYGWGNAPDTLCCDLSDERGWDDDPHFFFADTIREYRDIMVQNGHSNAQMWVTEFGWATWEGLPGDPPDAWISYNSVWDQGAYTLRAFQIGQETEYIGPMFLWNLNFAILPGMVENRDERAAYGLIVPLNVRERPLYWMLYDAIREDVQLERYD